MEHQFALVNGIKLHYVESGAGHLVILLHGFPEFWYAWRHQLAALGAAHHVVAPDMRGYNLSDKPGKTSAYDATEVARDIVALADHFHAETFSLVGHDWGGVIAWHVAMLYPERLDRLVIINAPHPAVMARELKTNPRQLMASSYVLFLRLPGAAKMLSAFRFALLRPTLTRGLKEGYFDDDDVEAYLEAWSQPGAIKGAVAYYKALEPLKSLRGKPDFVRTRITVPTMVIWGEGDPYLRATNLVGLDDYVDDLMIERVPASHWIVHEKPQLVNSLIAKFLRPVA